ncbi:hypothetical protein BDR22DRAFT_654669 [Usnea florida]
MRSILGCWQRKSFAGVIFAPSRHASLNTFAENSIAQWNVPSVEHRSFQDSDLAKLYHQSFTHEVVVKASGRYVEYRNYEAAGASLSATASR